MLERLHGEAVHLPIAATDNLLCCHLLSPPR
jgi:hypothetical protein